MLLLTGSLPFAFLIAVWLLRIFQGHGCARAFIEGFLAWAGMSYILAELLSVFNIIRFDTLVAFWLFSLSIVAVFLFRIAPWAEITLSADVGWPFIIVAMFATALAFITFTGDPNNFDSLTYRLPRIEHWIQNGSLAHFPTSDDRHNAHGPLAEVLLLHTRVLSGSDTLYGLVQWLSMMCCVAAAFRIPDQLGAGRLHSWASALFVATLPIGVLQSTSTQNDYVSAALLVSFVTFGLEVIGVRRIATLPLVEASAAGALAWIVKPSTLLIGAGFVIWFAIDVLRRGTYRLAAVYGLVALTVAIVVIGPFVARNTGTYGTVAGGQSAIVLNSSHGFAQTLDNAILNVALNFVTGFPQVDNIVRAGVLKVTFALGIDRNRSDTVFAYSEVQNPNSAGALLDDYGPSPVHCAFIICAYALLLRAPRRLMAYGAAALAGFVLFCFALRWQSWGVRLQLPIFVLMAPLVGMLLPDSDGRSWRTMAVMALMTLAGLPALLFNQGRPLLPFGSRPSYLAMSTEERHSNFYGSEFVSFTRNLMCRTSITKIGLMTAFNVAEYPIWQALRSAQTNRSFRVEHVGVPGGTRYPLGPFEPEIVMSVVTSGPEIIVGGRSFQRIFSTDGSAPPRISIYLAKGMPPIPADAGESRSAATSSTCR